jgi:hypothetical protein
MEAVCSSETKVSTYESTRRHNPEEQHRQLHHRENLKYHKNKLRQNIKIKLNVLNCAIRQYFAFPSRIFIPDFSPEFSKTLCMKGV